jgi:predicted dienelactone hydrolase
MIWRRILAAVLTTSITAVALPATAAHVTSPAAVSTPYRVVLPKPTGPYSIGTTEVHLTDSRRADPWRPGKRRELMVSVWYPTRSTKRQYAAYARPAVAPALGTEMASYLGLPGDSVDLAASTTHARTRAKPCGRHPVLLYSPGSGASRVIGTNQVEDLASRGYVVVTIDHTGEAPVEFPGGRVVGAVVPWDQPGAVKNATDTRTADVRFVLDSLPHLPRRLRHAMDLDRIGMFGAASAMPMDPRIDARTDLGTVDPDVSVAFTRHALDSFFRHFLKP